MLRVGSILWVDPVNFWMSPQQIQRVFVNGRHLEDVMTESRSSILLSFELCKEQWWLSEGSFRAYQSCKGASEDQKKKNMKASILNPDSHPLKHSTKKVIAIPGTQMTGLLASGLTTPWLQLLDGHARELTLDGGTLFKSCHLTHMSWTLTALTQQSKVWAWSQQSKVWAWSHH